MGLAEPDHFLLHDTLADNVIRENAPFLEWSISKIHTNRFTLGPLAYEYENTNEILEPTVDEDRNTEESKNHWAMIIETSFRSIRVSMESRTNNRTGERELLVVHMMSYTGPSSTVHWQTYLWQKAGTKVREVLVFILSRGWHRFKMSTTPEGAKKGCRHHL